MFPFWKGSDQSNAVVADVGSDLGFEYNEQLKRWIPKGANPADYVVQTKVAPPPTMGFINRPAQNVPLSNGPPMSSPSVSTSSLTPSDPSFEGNRIATSSPPLSHTTEPPSSPLLSGPPSSPSIPSMPFSSSPVSPPSSSSSTSTKRRGRYMDTLNPGSTSAPPIRSSIPSILPVGEMPKQSFSVFTPTKIADQDLTPAVIPDSTEILNSNSEILQETKENPAEEQK